jgi:hypothetical protein
MSLAMGPCGAHVPLALVHRGYWKRLLADFGITSARFGLRGSPERRSWSECAKLTACVVLGMYAASTALGTLGENMMTDAMTLLNTMNAKMAWDASAVRSRYTPLPRIEGVEGDERDEYGHLTFQAQCAALETKGRDPEWPLRDPHDDSDAGAGLGFETAEQLCEAMRRLPSELKIYSFPLSAAESRRYQIAELAPTFNRGYDVEGHIMEFMRAPPFSTQDPHEATAFLIPARPYLERVAAYPDSGRTAMTRNVKDMVDRLRTEESDVWRLSGSKKKGGGCARVMVSSHDTGTFAANDTDSEVKNKAVFIASNADSTTEKQAEDFERKTNGTGWRSAQARFTMNKDVSAVCSLSFHIPKDAVAQRAIVPMTVGDVSDASDGGGGRSGDEEEHRPVTLSFRGNDRGEIRERLFAHFRGLRKPDWDLRSEGQVTPSEYEALLGSSKFCLHVRGTRVQSPRLIEILVFGCVPVIIADGYELPLAWLLDWSKFSIRVPEDEYRALPELLEKADWAEMHENLRRAVGFFVYHRTPLVGDAFWTTMLGAWRQMKRGRACGKAPRRGGKKQITKITDSVRRAYGEFAEWIG